MSSDFSGKVAIITGASSGIGRVTAVTLAKRGAAVVLNGRNESNLQEVANECNQCSKRPIDSFPVVGGDICQDKIRQEIMKRAIDNFGRLDVLVNCAGISLPGTDIEGLNEERYDRVMDVNVKSAFFMSQLAIPHLEKSKGCIINISSILSTVVSPRFIPYSISKAAMDHMTRNMAVGLAPKGIRVNAINPSYVHGTGIIREFPQTNAQGDTIQTAFRNHEQRLQPSGKLVSAEDIANCVCFFASPEAKSITGVCQLVDAGRVFKGMS